MELEFNFIKRMRVQTSKVDVNDDMDHDVDVNGEVDGVVTFTNEGAMWRVVEAKQCGQHAVEAKPPTTRAPAASVLSLTALHCI